MAEKLAEKLIKISNSFLEVLAKTIGPGFHPDTPAEDYVNFDTNKYTFTAEEAVSINHGLTVCFAVLPEEEIYKMRGDAFKGGEDLG